MDKKYEELSCFCFEVQMRNFGIDSDPKELHTTYSRKIKRPPFYHCFLLIHLLCCFNIHSLWEFPLWTFGVFMYFLRNLKLPNYECKRKFKIPGDFQVHFDRNTVRRKTQTPVQSNQISIGVIWSNLSYTNLFWLVMKWLCGSKHCT